LKNSSRIKVRFFPEISLLHPGVLLEFAGKRILVDPGPDTDKRKAYYAIDRYRVHQLDAILLSHFHGDHAGLIKMILDTGQFKGPVICHPATADIVQAYYHGVRPFANQFVKLDYGVRYHLFDSVEVHFFNAGHVIGSSIISIQMGTKNITITGDLGARSLPLVRDPDTTFPVTAIDLLIIDAKQIHKKKFLDSSAYPVGDILYHKIKDCFLFDEGNILIYAPLVQIPSLLYCLNYIFESHKFQDIHQKVAAIYIDPQPKLLELCNIFKNYSFLFDRDEAEYVMTDSNPLDFDKLRYALPPEMNLRRSVIITPNRNVFVRYFEKLKRSEENDVLLLNDTIFHALKDSSTRIDRFCNIQIKRLPFLHYHPDVKELCGFCTKLDKAVGVEQIVLYHYRDQRPVERLSNELAARIPGTVQMMHELKNNVIII